MAVITIANSKGGSGKTFIATCLSYLFFHNGEGRTVAILDTEPRERLQTWYSKTFKNSVGPVFIQESNPQEVRPRIQQLEDEYDIVIVDTPGIDAHMTTIAISKSDFVIIPVMPSEEDVKDATKVYREVQQLDDLTVHNIHPLFVFVQTSPREQVFRHVHDQLIEQGYDVLETIIPRSTEVRKCTFAGGIPGLQHNIGRKARDLHAEVEKKLMGQNMNEETAA